LRIFRGLLCLSVSCCLLAADSTNPLSDPTAESSWADSLWNLPVTRWIMPLIAPPPAPPAPKAPAVTCKIPPLPPIVDPEAWEFEASVSPSTTGLVPAMTRALAKFEQLVSSAGGTFVLKSAYRPPSYQAHLQQVWYKWMELRNNSDPGCQELRAEVHNEFAGHHLIESQKPVTSSDHTRGLAFDATVVMPAPTRLKKVVVSLDRLALLAGIMRPDVIRDPVHYKLVVRPANRTASTE
jgi:hypothetical protein